MKKLVTRVCALALSMAVVLTGCGTGANSEKEGAADSGSANTAQNQSSVGDPTNGNTSSPQGSATQLEFPDPTTLTGELTVSCYETVLLKPFLEDAAKTFEAKYPGTKITIESFAAMPEVKTRESNGQKMMMMMKEDDSQEKTDYINKVNTEIMSGRGADVYALDILPFYKYINGGQLENLSPYMDNDPQFNAADYRSNILEATASPNGQYIIPLDYSFNYMNYDSTLFNESEQAVLDAKDQWTYEELIDLSKDAFARTNPDDEINNPLFCMTSGSGRGQSMFGALFQADHTAYLDIAGKKANFDDGKFVALLNTLKSYEESGYTDVPPDMSQMMTSPQMMERDAGKRFLYKPMDSMSLLSEYNKGSGRRVARRVVVGMISNSNDDKILGLPKSDGGDIHFTYSQAYGINANCENKFLAWAFIRHLCGDEVQLSMQLMGFPINKTAQARKAEMEFTGELFDPGNAGQELDAEAQAALENYLNAVEKYSAMLNAHMVEDTIVMDMVYEETASFFDGQKSAEDVAKTLQNKISLYLNE